jgi:hypothetical protein
VAHFAKFFAGVVETIINFAAGHRWEFATGINDTNSKFASGVNDTGAK